MAVPMLGRYEIVSVLGRGTMGTVYKALDTAIERTVAIKTLNPNLPAESLPEVKARFLREAKSAGQLNHPNVVVIYDVGEADGVAYIAMEYLAGQSLRQLLDSRTPLSFDHAAEIAAQIADALAYAHRQASCTAMSSRRISCCCRPGSRSSPTSASPTYPRPR
jgi:serine/threonine-protein kinase